MAKKNKLDVKVQQGGPLLKDFLTRPEVYAEVIGEMVQDGTLDPKKIEDSEALKECARRIYVKEVEQEIARQKRAEEVKVKIDQAITSLKALSFVFDGDKTEFIAMIIQLAFDQNVEFTIIDPDDTRIIDGKPCPPSENTVLFKNGTFAVRCFHSSGGENKDGKIFLKPYELITEEDCWKEMVRRPNSRDTVY